MEILKTLKSVDNFLGAIKPKKTIALVPTMGALHEGHISLVRKARKENNIVVVSIFVNPTQFGRNEDLSKYPRTLRSDKKKLLEEGVDAIFLPKNDIMYSPDYRTYITVENMSSILCGSTRPTHFKGVATVVAKLFNIIRPHTAYFGEKDYQQLILIKRMVEDLNIHIKIKGVPTVREGDGLAMSSRNRYLNSIERADASLIYKALQKARSLVKSGEYKSSVIINAAKEVLREGRTLSVDYISIADGMSLEPLEIVKKNSRMFVAVYSGSTRLIDNIKML